MVKPNPVEFLPVAVGVFACVHVLDVVARIVFVLRVSGVVGLTRWKEVQRRLLNDSASRWHVNIVCTEGGRVC